MSFPCRSILALGRIIKAISFLLLLGCPQWVLAQGQFCPPGSRPVAGGGGTMCLCPDGSYAGIGGCASARRPQLPPGAVPCGSGYCQSGYMCVNSNQCQSIAESLKNIQQNYDSAQQQALTQQQNNIRQQQSTRAVGSVYSLMSAFGSNVPPGRINVPGALPDGYAGIIWAQQNAVRMTNVLWNPIPQQPSDPFAARTTVQSTPPPPRATSTPSGPQSAPSPYFVPPGGVTGFQQETENNPPSQPWFERAYDWMRSRF